MAHKDSDDLFTYQGGHAVQASNKPKHRANPDHQNHKKPAPAGKHAQGSN